MTMDSCNWACTVSGMVALDNLILINHYDIKLHFSVNTPDPMLQNVAFDRIKFFYSNVFNNSILIGSDNKKLDSFKTLFPANNFIELPADPVDYYLAQSLWAKTNKITGGNMGISILELSSDMSDGVNFVADGGDMEILHNPEVKRPWWTSETPKTNLFQDFSPWKQFGLEFEQEHLTKSKKPARIIKVKNFSPTVLKKQ